MTRDVRGSLQCARKRSQRDVKDAKPSLRMALMDDAICATKRRKQGQICRDASRVASKLKLADLGAGAVRCGIATDQLRWPL